MKKKFKLTKEEEAIERSLEEGGWGEVPVGLKQAVERAAKAGVLSKKREARVNIRLNQSDVDLIRQKAEEEGLGYQTLMSSVLHKYATGRLVERNMLDQVASEFALKIHQSRKKAAG